MAAADFRRPLTGLCAVRRSQDVRPVRAGAFGPGRPSPAPGSLTIICEVIEAFGRALPDLAAATKVWRDLFPAAEEVYTQGLRFMKEKWAAAAK